MPSDELLFYTAARWREGVVFLPRHGRGHLSPSNLNFRANIDALKQARVTEIIFGQYRRFAEGGTRRADFVLIDQFIDRTFAREKSFSRGCIAHVSK